MPISNDTRIQKTHNLRIFYIFPLSGVFLLLVSAFLYWQQSQFLSKALSAEGSIVDFAVSYEDSKKVYAPIVSYVNNKDEEIEFTSTKDRPIKTYPIGAKVEVLYSEDGAIDKIKSFYELWFMTSVTFVMGSIFTFIGIIVIRNLKKVKPHEAHSH